LLKFHPLTISVLTFYLLTICLLIIHLLTICLLIIHLLTICLLIIHLLTIRLLVMSVGELTKHLSRRGIPKVLFTWKNEHSNLALQPSASRQIGICLVSVLLSANCLSQEKCKVID
jgi:hypothetical protein